MGLYEVSLSMSLVGFGMGTILGNFHMCGIILLLRASLYMLVRNATSKGPMCFSCLMFSLAGPCCSVNGSVCRVCCVFVNCLVKQFAIFLGVVFILLLNVIKMLTVRGGALLDRPCIVFQRMFVCSACDPSVHLDVPSIGYVCVCRK